MFCGSLLRARCPRAKATGIFEATYEKADAAQDENDTPADVVRDCARYRYLRRGVRIVKIDGGLAFRFSKIAPFRITRNTGFVLGVAIDDDMGITKDQP